MNTNASADLYELFMKEQENAYPKSIFVYKECNVLLPKLNNEGKATFIPFPLHKKNEDTQELLYKYRRTRNKISKFNIFSCVTEFSNNIILMLIYYACLFVENDNVYLKSDNIQKTN